MRLGTIVTVWGLLGTFILCAGLASGADESTKAPLTSTTLAQTDGRADRVHGMRLLAAAELWLRPQWRV